MKNSLKKYRQKLGITQLEMSEILEISQSMVSHIENNEEYAEHFKSYIKILANKGIDLNELFR